MSLGINFFMGSQVSSTKIWMKNSRFSELSTGEVQKIMDNAIPVTKHRHADVQESFFL